MYCVDGCPDGVGAMLGYQKWWAGSDLGVVGTIGDPRGDIHEYYCKTFVGTCRLSAKFLFWKAIIIMFVHVVSASSGVRGHWPVTMSASRVFQTLRIGSCVLLEPPIVLLSQEPWCYMQRITCH